MKIGKYEQPLQSKPFVISKLNSTSISLKLGPIFRVHHHHNMKIASRLTPPSDFTRKLLSNLMTIARLSQLARLSRAASLSRPLCTTSPSATATSGPQPLLDSFKRRHTYLRLSLTERCNLRCQYCMPASGVPLTPNTQLLTTAELLRLGGIFASRGVDKVRLTGGEPLLRRDIVDIVSGLREHGPRVVLTTNGVHLERMLPGLVAAGVDGVNVSLDTLDGVKFEEITLRRGFERVVGGIRAAVESGVRTKVNVVVVRGVNDGEVGKFVRLTERMEVDVRFIEYMPFGGNGWERGGFVGYAEMLEGIAKEFGCVHKVMDGVGDTDKKYRVDGFVGRVGFVTSMTEHFCAECNRVRVTADGNLKVCLFGREEVSLRDAMRGGMTDEEIENVIEEALEGKHWMLGGSQDMHELARKPNRSMIRIGG